MSYIGSTEWFTQVSLGKVPGWSWLEKFGQNPDIDSGPEEDVHYAGGDYQGQDPTAAELITLVSSSASDVGTCTIVAPLDGSYDEQTDEDVTLTGVTGVDSTGSYLRSNRGIYRGHGAVPKSGNVGTITATGKTSAKVYWTIPAATRPTGQTLVAAWTVPNTKRFVFYDWYGGSSSGAASAALTFTLWVRLFEEIFVVKDRRGHDARYGNTPWDFRKRIVVPAKADIKISCDSSGNNIPVVAGFSGAYGPA